MNKTEYFRNMVAQGWTAMLLVFLANIVMDIVRVTVQGNPVPWAEHMGMAGVQFILVVLSVYALMPMLIRTISVRWFRYAMVGVSAFMGLFVAAHEVSHLVAADKPFGLLHALDLTHHVLSAWTVIAAVMWARQKE